MVVPDFFAAGTGATTTGATSQPPYPASVANLDIAIAQHVIRSSSAFPSTYPGDWAKVGDQSVTGLNHAWAWKRLDGTETGTISITGAPGGGVGAYSRIYVFRGCVISGDPYEAATQTSGSSTTFASSAISTLSADRLATCVIAVGDDNAAGDLTGSNVTWAEVTPEFTSTDGADGMIVVDAADVFFPTAVTAGSFVMAATDPWHTFTFALIPAAEVLPPRYGAVNYQNPGVF